ncbi:hypothetical protein PGT21_012941 [Puccinia graminis f. sp. tritici]|uniref:Uncharacterized protein n=1 Tax=Puccinia graminis f. sp. tritici TaxID=56615 RepID=A0A5B0MWG7_PUCGR|nr:hypothetical protein PGT21_012941 [Puccinia graminis f. sp. tritici]
MPAPTGARSWSTRVLDPKNILAQLTSTLSYPYYMIHLHMSSLNDAQVEATRPVEDKPPTADKVTAEEEDDHSTTYSIYSEASEPHDLGSGLNEPSKAAQPDKDLIPAMEIEPNQPAQGVTNLDEPDPIKYGLLVCFEFEFHTSHAQRSHTALDKTEEFTLDFLKKLMKWPM